MKKISKSAELLALAQSPRRRLPRLGRRLLFFLVIAEAPLLFFTAFMAVQNDRLRESDALSLALRDQLTTLLQMVKDVQTAIVITGSFDSLPDEVVAQSDACDIVTQALLAPVDTQVLSASLFDAEHRAACTSLDRIARANQLLSMASHASSTSARLLPLDGNIFVSRPLHIAGRQEVAVLQIRSGQEEPLLWVDAGTGPTPLNGASNTALPPGNKRRSTRADGVKGYGRDGELYLYSHVALPPPLRGELLAASNIGAAARSSEVRIAVRLAEILLLFTAELALIAAGMNVVLTSPLRQLNAAVRRWQRGGGYQDQAGHNGTRELQDLSASFAAAAHSLSERERELGNSLHQQGLLMREIHHRVKNNLQIIASLLNLQASRIKVPEARAEFQASRDRVRALATLHRHLYADGEVDSIRMRDFFAELCGQLMQASGETDGERITLEASAPDVRVSSDQAVPIALVVTEIVGNALKHAFPGRRQGRICVRLEEEAAGMALLTVGDNGVGNGPQSATSAGLGTQLIRGFVRQLGATLDVSHECGTWYRIRMPLQRQLAENTPPRPGNPG